MNEALSPVTYAVCSVFLSDATTKKPGFYPLTPAPAKELSTRRCAAGTCHPGLAQARMALSSA
jgi:hypothetical protein